MTTRYRTVWTEKQLKSVTYYIDLPLMSHVRSTRGGGVEFIIKDETRFGINYLFVHSLLLLHHDLNVQIVCVLSGMVSKLVFRSFLNSRIPSTCIGWATFSNHFRLLNAMHEWQKQHLHSWSLISGIASSPLYSGSQLLLPTSWCQYYYHFKHLHFDQLLFLYQYCLHYRC